MSFRSFKFISDTFGSIRRGLDLPTIDAISLWSLNFVSDTTERLMIRPWLLMTSTSRTPDLLDLIPKMAPPSNLGHMSDINDDMIVDPGSESLGSRLMYVIRQKQEDHPLMEDEADLEGRRR